MNVIDLILSNEAQNDGHTIFLYQEENKRWSAYGISAFLLFNVMEKVNVQNCVFNAYQVKMPFISVTEQQIEIAEQQAKNCTELLGYKIIQLDFAYSSEAYISWLKKLKQETNSLLIVN